MLGKAVSALAGLVLVLLLPLTVHAQGGAIKGQVVNKTTDKAVPGQTVSLHIDPAQGGTGKTVDSTTNSAGRFTFEGVEPSSGNKYALCTTYQGAMYHEPLSLPSAKEGEGVINLTVYDATESREGISLQSHHLVFNPLPERAAVEVTELLIFQNSGNRTFVGSASGGQAGPTLRFTLPRDASELTLHSGVNEEEISHLEGAFVSSAPVFPGQTSVAYSYLLPASKGSMQLVRALDYAPAQVALLIGDGKGILAGPGIASQGPVDFNGTVYQLYGVSLLPGATALEVTASGWPGGSGGASAAAKYAPALAGAVAGGGLLGVLAHAIFKGRRQRTAVATASVSPGTVDEEED